MHKLTFQFGWIFGLYFIEGLPNAIVGTLSVGYYKSMGMSNTDIAMLTSLLYVPWMIKGFWGPLVDSVSSKRRWIVFCSSIFTACFVALAAVQFFPFWIAASAAVFWILGFSSATYDIAADGFYMLALNQREQSFFVGIRNAFYRVAVLFGQGAMLYIAGCAAGFFGDTKSGWAFSFTLCGIIVAFCLLMFMRFLPCPSSDTARRDSSASDIFKNLKGAIVEFFGKKHILSILAFVLFYRFAEAELLKAVQPFLFDSRSVGGLGMDMRQVGTIYGTLAPILLLVGGILGGFFISKTGLRRSLLLMAVAMNVPNLIYVYLAAAQPESLFAVACLIGLEQFGYGFGFAGYMVYLMFASNGKNKTSSYALCTSFMALGLILPGFYSGALQEYCGYVKFFEFVALSTLVSFFVTVLAIRTIPKNSPQNS